MGLILPVVFLGLMASLSPATIVVFVLVLGTARARVNAVGFLFGWGLSLTVVFALSYALALSGETQEGGGRHAVAVIELLLGAALVVVGARVWRRGPTAPTGSPAEPTSAYPACNDSPRTPAASTSFAGLPFLKTSLCTARALIATP